MRVAFNYLILLTIIWGSAAYAQASCEPLSGQTSPLAYPYPLVMKGPPAAVGAPVRSLAAFAKKQGQWISVPLQVDEVNSRGDYVLSAGLPYTRHTDDGVFDANDEIAVDGESLGEAFADSDLHPLVQKRAHKYWRVRFCRQQAGAAVWLGDLLVAWVDVPPMGPQVEAAFSPERMEVETSLYRYRFRHQNPALLGEVFLRDGNVESPVFLDAQFIMPLKLPFFLPDMSFRDDDFTSRVESWQVGPVRTIVAVGVKYTAFLSLLRLHLFSELVFYRNRFVIPTVIEFIFDPTSLLAAGSGVAYSLRFPEGQAWKTSSNLPKLPPHELSVEVAQKNTALQLARFEMLGHSPKGSFQAVISVDEAARRASLPPYLINGEDFDDKGLNQIHPWLKGMTGDIGVFVDFSQVPKGVYDFGLDLLLSTKADETFTDFGAVDFQWQHLPR